MMMFTSSRMSLNIFQGPGNICGWQWWWGFQIVIDQEKENGNHDDDVHLIEGECEHQWTSDDDDAVAADDDDAAAADDDDADDANDDNVHLIESKPEHLPGNNCPLSKGGSPEVGGITAINTSQLDVFFSLICFFSVVDMTHKRSYSYKFDGQISFIAPYFSSSSFDLSHLLVILKLSPANTPWGNTALSSLSIWLKMQILVEVLIYTFIFKHTIWMK